MDYRNLTLTDLKNIARGSKIPRFSTYTMQTKNELIRILIDANIPYKKAIRDSVAQRKASVHREKKDIRRRPPPPPPLDTLKPNVTGIQFRRPHVDYMEITKSNCPKYLKSELVDLAESYGINTRRTTKAKLCKEIDNLLTLGDPDPDYPRRGSRRSHTREKKKTDWTIAKFLTTHVDVISKNITKAEVVDFANSIVGIRIPSRLKKMDMINRVKAHLIKEGDTPVRIVTPGTPRGFRPVTSPRAPRSATPPRTFRSVTPPPPVTPPRTFRSVTPPPRAPRSMTPPHTFRSVTPPPRAPRTPRSVTPPPRTPRTPRQVTPPRTFRPVSPPRSFRPGTPPPTPVKIAPRLPYIYKKKSDIQKAKPHKLVIERENKTNIDALMNKLLDDVDKRVVKENEDDEFVDALEDIPTQPRTPHDQLEDEYVEIKSVSTETDDDDENELEERELQEQELQEAEQELEEVENEILQEVEDEDLHQIMPQSFRTFTRSVGEIEDLLKDITEPRDKISAVENVKLSIFTSLGLVN